MDAPAHLCMSPLCPRTATWKHQVIVCDGGGRPVFVHRPSPSTAVWWPRHASFTHLPSPSAAIGRMIIPAHTCNIPAAPSCSMGTPVHIPLKAPRHHTVACSHISSHLSCPIIDTWWHKQDCLYSIYVHGGAGTTVYVLAVTHGHHVAVWAC